MKKFIIILCLILMFFGCESLGLDIGPINEYKLVRTENKDLEHPSIHDTLSFFRHQTILGIDSFEIIKVMPKNGNPFYFISCIYKGEDWRFMKGDIKIKTDNRLYILHDDKPYHSVLSGGVMEILSDGIEKSIIYDMANSKELKIQIHLEPLDIPAQNIKFIKRFYDEEIK